MFLPVDMRIHYPISKLLYSPSYAPFDLGSLKRLPVVYGMWHAYQYCVPATRRKLLPLCTFWIMVSLETGSVVVNT